MTGDGIKKISCPSCGAPLLFGAGEATTRCHFCNAVVERPEPARRKTEREKPKEEPPFIYHLPVILVETAVSTSSRPLLGLLVAGGAVLALGVVLFLVFSAGAPDTILKPALNISGPVVILPSAEGQPPDFLALGYDILAENYPIARLNPAGHRIVWRGPTFESISDVRAIAAGGDKFYAVEGDRLYAYSAADGSSLWQADLTDQLGYCGQCLSTQGGRVIAFTQDYVVQAFDAASGNIAWTRRLFGPSNSYSIERDSLLVVDKEDEDYSLFVLSLGDGSVLKRITPECAPVNGSHPEQLDNVSMMVLDQNSAAETGSDSVYLFYGWYPGCIERRDLSTGDLKWQQMDERGFSPSGDLATLVTAETIFFAADNNLWAADTANGEIRLVTQTQDYELVPLALAGDTLIVRSIRTRGSTQFGLWGMDPKYGEKTWEHELKNSEPLDPPDVAMGLVDDDGWAWTWHMMDGQIFLLEFQANPNQLAVSRLDPHSGSVLDEKHLALGVEDDFYFIPAVLAWQDPTAWLVVDRRIIGVDISSASVKYSYP